MAALKLLLTNARNAYRAITAYPTVSVRNITLIAILMILTNGPVFLFSQRVLDRTRLWEDLAVWPFFATAALASAVLAVLTLRREGQHTPNTTAKRFSGPNKPAKQFSGIGVTGSKVATTAVAFYSLAAVASALWSVHAGNTLWRAVVYLGLALLAVVIARLEPDDLHHILAAVTFIAITSSLLLVLLRPDIGIDDNGDWRGLYTNRNSLAPLAALGVIVGIRTLTNTPRTMHSGLGWPRFAFGGIQVALSLTTMFMAGSRTAMIALIIAVSVTTAQVPVVFQRLSYLCSYLYRRWRTALTTAGSRWKTVLTTVAVAATATSAAIVTAWQLQLDRILERPFGGYDFFGTLDQRFAIWQLLWDRILERPFGGYGFFIFWENQELVAEHELLGRGSAHNSLVETALGLGLLGTIPFVVIVMLAARNAGRDLWHRPSADTWMWAAVVTFVLVENITESFVLWFSYAWVLLMVAAMRTSGNTCNTTNNDNPGLTTSATATQPSDHTDQKQQISTIPHPTSESETATQPSDHTDRSVSIFNPTSKRLSPTSKTKLHKLPSPLRSGWTVVALICLAVLALWLPDLDLPLGNSDDGRILGRFGLHARNFWELGPIQSRMGALIEPFWRPEYNVVPRTSPPQAAVVYAHHPPLQLFASIASFGMLGDNPAALRSTGFVLGSATVAFMAALLRVRGLAWGPTLLAVAAMVSTGFFYVYARIGVGFSLLIAATAMVSWLRDVDRPPRWTLACAATLTALAAMQSWIAMVAVALLVLWLFTGKVRQHYREETKTRQHQRRPRWDADNGVEVQPHETRPVIDQRRPRWDADNGVASLNERQGNRDWLTACYSPAVIAVALGASIGIAVTAAWMLNATDISELIDRVMLRSGNDVNTANTSTQATHFNFNEFLKRQWGFANEELLVPIWLRVMLLPALIAGLADRRTRMPTAITLFVAAVLTFGFQQGAWIHRLWNFPWLAPATIGLAAAIDTVRRLLTKSWTAPAATLAVVILAFTTFFVVTGSTRTRYLTDPSAAGSILEQIQYTDAAVSAEGVWVTRETPTARWVSYYLDIPVWPLNESRLKLIKESDLLILRSDKIPDWLPHGANSEPLAEAGVYQVITAINLTR